jgi:hypothetical protein
MHSQIKRRKRTMDGLIKIERTALRWQLISEPQFTTAHGYKGLCLSVRAEEEGQRELILEYPYPANKFGSPLPLPQRPTVSEKSVEVNVRRAIAAGWDPVSRGKKFIYHVPEPSS